MGRLVPEDFPLRALANEAEVRVVEALRDRLSDEWLILPDVGLRTHRDHQLDVVLVHQDWGVVDLEVKGHRMQLQGGAWYHAGSRLEPQPLDQARSNAYALRSLLRAEGGDLAHVDVHYGVALPNTSGISGALPPDARPEQLLLAPHLDDPQPAIHALLLSGGARALTRASVETIVATLRPDAMLSWDPEARATDIRQRLDDLCTMQVAALETLDANRRAYVTGRAGTGKTRLATGWAQRAWTAGQRVLLTCYNDPLAADLQARFPFADDALVIGGFLRVALTLPGMPPLPVPEGADHEWWNTEAIAHLMRHWPEVTARFDTVVVDEGQDFHPTWISMLEQLLDPDGPRRLLLLADDRQDLYTRGFRAPSPDDGWTVAELVNNCRNAHGIASILRRHFDGARSPMVGPEGFPPEWLPADDLDALVRDVDLRVVDLLELDERDTSHLVVATFTTSVRDRLRAELGYVRWEERGDGRVACENVHRIKGLEADTVILASPTNDVTDALLYTGISRAVSQLVLVGPAALAARLGLRA